MPPTIPPWTSSRPRCPLDTTAAPGVPLGAPPKDAMVLGMQPPLDVGGGDGAADATPALRPSVASTDTDAAPARRAVRIGNSLHLVPMLPQAPRQAYESPCSSSTTRLRPSPDLRKLTRTLRSVTGHFKSD